MELRELAERVIFGTTLEEKLGAPPVVTDLQPGPARESPASPSRPAELRFKPSQRLKAEVPGRDRLDQPRERGRLLHFFANHELLATELMALVLLRFPDAPPEFRRGVLQTLRDEQEHTRLYLDRMRACGITFGEWPVSGYFWRCVAPMRSPIDFVAGLSLTFEQANLDFSLEFARRFAQAGDPETAGLLQRIHHDEIAHVAHGLKWFRRWKDPADTDWTAFCRRLHFPLSPQRAKGPVFESKPRLAAGLAPDFVESLEAYSRSRGRTPNVFLFNPFAEGHIARGPAFTPTGPQIQLARDLATLPQFLAREDDVVLVPEKPRAEFLRPLRAAGLPIPEFLALPPQGGLPALEPERKLGALKPWAWSPDSLELLGPWFTLANTGQRPPSHCFNREIARLYSKGLAATVLREILESPPPREFGTSHWREETWLCPLRAIGVVANSPHGVLSAIEAIRASGHHRVVVKETLGVAGANALRLWEPALLDTQRRWLERAVENGGEVIVEPWQERVFDFSAQFEMRPDGLTLVGFTQLLVDHRGQFEGNRALPRHAKHPPAPAAALLSGPRDVRARLSALYQAIGQALEPILKTAGFVGPVSIDAFVFRDPDGTCRLKPIVEINPRYTMGRLTLELMKYVKPGGHGTFRLIRRNPLQRLGHADFPAFAAWLARRYPLKLEGRPIPRISEGALCLNDPAVAESVLALFEVGSAPAAELTNLEAT